MYKKTSDKKKVTTKTAEDWVAKLENDPTFLKAINECVVVYDGVLDINVLREKVPTAKYEKTVTDIYKQDVCICVKAANAHGSKEDRIALLDFASYTNPGGGFIKGAMAQEEAICHQSALYNVLKRNETIYTEARKKDDFSYDYKDDVIYLKDLPFFFNRNIVKADCIVAAAPNRKGEKRVGKEIMDDALLRRMEVSFLLPSLYGVNTVLLGAFGCGVFGNDIEVVASEWKRLSDEVYPGLYKKVIHPVLDEKQCKVFKQIYGKK